MAVRKIIKIDEEKCDGCGLCIPNCAEGALQIVNGKAKLVKDTYCDGLGACLGHCPNDALTIVEREADEFDEEAALAHVQSIANDKMQHPDPAPVHTLPCGCPSAAMVKELKPKKHAETAQAQEHCESLLSNWPVQIHLVPEDAPYLKGTDILIASDCVLAAYRPFHSDFVAGKVLLVGCPKLDDADYYRQKLTGMFKRNSPNSVTVVRMEVPCCGGMPALVKDAIRESGVETDCREVTVGIQGDVLADTAAAPTAP
jgi:ferredoxin